MNSKNDEDKGEIFHEEFELKIFADYSTNYTVETFTHTRIDFTTVDIDKYIVDGIVYYMMWSVVNSTDGFMNDNMEFYSTYRERYYQYKNNINAIDLVATVNKSGDPVAYSYHDDTDTIY